MSVATERTNPIGNPIRKGIGKINNPREPSITPYVPKQVLKSSMFEAQIPNKITRTVDPFESTIGEKPIIPFHCPSSIETRRHRLTV